MNVTFYSLEPFLSYYLNFSHVRWLKGPDFLIGRGTIEQGESSGGQSVQDMLYRYLHTMGEGNTYYFPIIILPYCNNLVLLNDFVYRIMDNNYQPGAAHLRLSVYYLSINF